MEHGRGVRREPQSSSIPTPRFDQGIGTLNPFSHAGGTFSHNGMMDYPRYPFSEMHLGILPDSLEFQSWKVNFKTEVCATSAFLHITMNWIREVEIAKSIDDLITSQSIIGRRDFPYYEMLDAKIASALKKLLTSVHFRRRISVEGQRAQKDDRFSRGRQIAYMIYEHFRATGAFEALQGLSDTFNIHLQNDDVQDFDTRWDQALLAASEIPTGMVLEGFYKSKLPDSVQLQTVLAMYERENVRNNEPPNCSRLKTMVRRHIDQTMRTRNFRALSEIVERGAVTKSQKREKSQREEESGRMLSVESNWTVFEKETHVVSVMNERLETDAIRDKKDNRPLLRQKRRHRLTERLLGPSRVSQLQV